MTATIIRLSSFQRPDCSLKRVDVHRTDIGAEGMDALGSAIEANTSLTKINAGGNEVRPVFELDSAPTSR